MSKMFFCVLLVCGVCILFGAPVLGQEKQGTAEPSPGINSEGKTDSSSATSQTVQPGGPTQPETQPKEKGEKTHSKLPGLVVAPLPISSPAIGSGITPVLGYIFPISKKDKVSPPSVVGAAGLITDNGSRGFVVGGQIFFKENKYEITSGFVHGNINYNIYGNGVAANLKLPLQQTGEGFLGEFLRRLGWKFFAGLGL